MVDVVTPRRQWTTELICPTCKKTGIANISEENDNGARDDPLRTVNSVTDGFRVVPGEAHSLDTAIFCAACNVCVW